VRTFTQLRLLSREEAGKGRPARFLGTVLCYDPGWGQLYVHDGAETKYFSPQSLPLTLESGLRVEITGATTFVADYPALTNLQLVKVGRAELPRAKPLALRDLATGFGQWVETTGRVRVAETSRGRLALAIEDRGQSCLVFVMGVTATNDSLKRLVRARVRVRGINASTVSQGRLQSASIFAPGISEVTLLEPSGMRPEQLPVVSIDSLLNRQLGAWTNEMVHINGFIAAYEPGEFVRVKDPTGLIRVHVKKATAEQILLRGTDDGVAVQLEARLLQDVPHSASPRLVLQDGTLIFTAQLAGQTAGEHLPQWRSGSVLRLSGVCSIQGTENHEPDAFRLLVARAADVRLVHALLAHSEGLGRGATVTLELPARRKNLPA